MNEKMKEQVSTMFDNELDEQEHELLIRRLKQDDSMQSSWQHYQIIGNAMRNDLKTTSMSDMLTNIRHDIDNEPPISASEVSSRVAMRMVKPVAGLAIAASVAAMAIVGLQNVGQVNSPVLQTPRLAQSLPATEIHRVSGTRWNQQQPETEMRLNGYLVNHSEYSSSFNLQGMINYARIAGYDSRKDK